MKKLIAVQLVVEEAEERFAFRHALTRQAIYTQLLLRERKALHRTIADYEQRRNEAAMPIYEITRQFAMLEPPPPEIQQLFAALRHNQEQTNRFLGVALAGTVPIPEFCAPENLGRIMDPAAETRA